MDEYRAHDEDLLEDSSLESLTRKMEHCATLGEMETLISCSSIGCGAKNTEKVGSLFLNHLVKKMITVALPGGNEREQYRLLKEVISDIEPVNREGNEQSIKIAVGNEVVELVNKESRLANSLHLSSILAGYARKTDMQNILGRKVTNNAYRAMLQHRRHPGPGRSLVTTHEFMIHRRQRIQEKSIQDFVEWLNAVGLLQNLAFGEKVVQFNNGFHVAIESVKRTQSVQNIVRYYYRRFLVKGSDENSSGDYYDKNATDDDNSSTSSSDDDQDYLYEHDDEDYEEDDVYSDDDGKFFWAVIHGGTSYCINVMTKNTHLNLYIRVK